MLVKSHKFAEGFESVGIAHQYNATTLKMADRAFANSCDRCCSMGVSLNCDRCGIANAHNTVALIFNNKSITI